MRRGRLFWFLLLLEACGTPARRLSTRAVEDPMVLPRRMLKLTYGGSLARNGARQSLAAHGPIGLDYGLTNRLQLTGLLSLEYAFLDDAPRPDDLRRPPFSLSVRAGVVGIGGTSTWGFFMVPVVAMRLRKHLGERTQLDATLSTQSRWVERSVPTAVRRDDLLFPLASRMSLVMLSTGMARQLANRWTASLSVEVHQFQSCAVPLCAWDSRGGSVSLGPSFRPWHWLTISGDASVGLRGRPAGIEPITPIDVVDVPPATVSWVSGSLAAAFAW
jgi:hypothetical protein